MNKAIISFVLSALLGFGLGYLVFGVIMDTNDNDAKITQADHQESTTAKESTEPKEETSVATPESDNILNQKGCLSCHSVDSLGLKGGTTGPDLSKAYENVEGKHGKPIEEFLKEPTSAVMSSVISGNPLTDDERVKVIELLKKASEN
jgi:cytochrome c551/c552